MNWDEWVAKCRAILESNQISKGGLRYSRLAPQVYEEQWLWDSCFHAIVYRWFDLKMAQDELISLTAHQVQDGDDAGMIPHMFYWQRDGSDLWGRADRSIITQPPLISIAAKLVYQRSGDKGFLELLFPRLAAYHAWFDRRRDPDGDHLVSLIHPWESGWDASPRWDAPMKLVMPTPEQTKAARHNLVKDLIRYECDAAALAQAGFYYVETVDFNAIRAADLEALAEIADILGQASSKWREKAHAVQNAVRQKMIQSDGIFDLSGSNEDPIPKPSCAPFILLFGGCVTPTQAADLVTELKSARFWTPYPVPTTPTNDPYFNPSDYWRGNVWMSVNWLIYQGLRRYGYLQEAHELAERCLALVESHGFHEYFNPLTGEGLGAGIYSWSTLVLDMLAMENG